MQPETGKLTPVYQCDSLFVGCANLKLSGNSLDPVTLIQTHRIIFNKQYSFNVTLSNTALKPVRSASDSFSFQVNSPEQSFEPLSCLSFQLIFKNKTIGFTAQNSNLREVFFENNNYTEVSITGVTVSTTACTATYGTSISTLAFAVFDNPMLFEDMHSNVINTTAITLSSTKI